MAHDSFGLVGTSIEGKYRVDGAIGEGGFGVVYKGAHLDFGATPIAIKCLKIPHGFTDEGRAAFIDSFRREGALLLPLSAVPGVVRVLAFGVTKSRVGAEVPFLVLEWLDGESLEKVLLDRAAKGLGPFSEREALAILRPIVDAVAAAHALPHASGRGVAHRDLKPANIMHVRTHRGTVWKVLDFGIAKAMQEGETATQLQSQTSSGISAFSPGHGAPEQFQAKKYGVTGPWTDVHALGLILVELLTGRAALDGDDLHELFESAKSPTRPTPRARGAVVSDACEALCAKALAVSAKERFPDADAMLNEIDAMASASMLPVSLTPTPAPAPVNPATVLFAPIVIAPPPRSGKKETSKRAILLGTMVTAIVFGLGSSAAGLRTYACEAGSVRSCEIRCGLGNMASCSVLGLMYDSGTGVAKDAGKAVELYRKACDGGEMKGCTNLGVMYDSGVGVAKDDTKAVELYRKACDGGEMTGCANLGLMYDNGTGVAKDAGKAAELSRMACDGGKMNACGDLGNALLFGRGVVPNRAGGIELLRKACASGREWSCSRLRWLEEPVPATSP